MSKDSFLTPLIVEVMPSGKKFQLHEPFTFDWRGVRIRVVQGFETDLASIPTTYLLLIATALIVVGRYARVDWLLLFGVVIVFLMALIPKLGRQNKAAVIHDAIYRGKYEAAEGDTIVYFVDRKDADKVFSDGMAEQDVIPWKRRMMYRAVRLFGWIPWRARRWKK